MTPAPRSPRKDEPEDRTVCTPCRGTGKALSSLGGVQHEVDCPWCAGTGRFQPGRDAQTDAKHETGG
jgi:DnaJ-class molecular chaperone